MPAHSGLEGFADTMLVQKKTPIRWGQATDRRREAVLAEAESARTDCMITSGDG
jgi:hypothetical protein